MAEAMPDPEDENGDVPNASLIVDEPIAREHFARGLIDALDAMDEGPDAVEALAERMFGTDPSQAIENAALAHVDPTGAGEADGTEGRFEKFIRLSFKQARGETSAEEDAELVEVQAELAAGTDVLASAEARDDVDGDDGPVD